jgi:hypothetical protein
LSYQTDKLRITKFSKPKGGGGVSPPQENFEKLDPKSCILRVSASVQIFLKNQVFFTRSNKKIVNDHPSVVDRWFEPQSGQTKDYKIGMCFLSARIAALGRKRWLLRLNSSRYHYYSGFQIAIGHWPKINQNDWIFFGQADIMTDYFCLLVTNWPMEF